MIFADLKKRQILLILALLVAPHFLNDVYIVTLNRFFVHWPGVPGVGRPELSVGRWVMWALDFAVYLCWPVGVLWWCARRGWLRWRHLDLGWDEPGSYIFQGLLLFAGIWLLAYFKALWLDPFLRPLMPRYSYDPFFYSPKDGLLLYGVMTGYLALGAGLLEEIIYRSVLIRGLERLGWSTPLAAGTALAAFVLIHLSAGAPIMVVSLLVGAIFTWLYLNTRNITPLVVAHTAIDVMWISGGDSRLFSFLSRLF